MNQHTKEMFARATNDTAIRDRLSDALDYGEHARKSGVASDNNPYNEDTTDGLMWSVGWNLEDSRRKLREATAALYVAQPWRIAKALYGKNSWPVKDGVSGIEKTLDEVHQDFDCIYSEQGRSDELDIVEDALFQLARLKEDEDYERMLMEQADEDRETASYSTMHYGRF